MGANKHKLFFISIFLFIYAYNKSCLKQALLLVVNGLVLPDQSFKGRQDIENKIYDEHEDVIHFKYWIANQRLQTLI